MNGRTGLRADAKPLHGVFGILLDLLKYLLPSGGFGLLLSRPNRPIGDRGFNDDVRGEASSRTTPRGPAPQATRPRAGRPFKVAQSYWRPARTSSESRSGPVPAEASSAFNSSHSRTLRPRPDPLSFRQLREKCVRIDVFRFHTEIGRASCRERV